ncbi:probable polygalacturonase At3g15720 [Henckelia pumila]|uniref:probable polygalacturonase At3g15720 n=1 Tax=Henckelia pumila TaxID=405737 RepID=UPI003C6EA1ED
MGDLGKEFVKYFVILGLILILEPKIAADEYDTIHDVTNYGAVGDGITDDTKAFESAWEAACTSGSSNSVIVPTGEFLVSRIVFQGPCKFTSLSFQILGKIVAPPRSKWRKTVEHEWLYFHNVDGLNVTGNGQGVIHGNGLSWWSTGVRPTALRFSHCHGLTVSGLKHVDSQRNHISINECNNVIITNLHIVAPILSPNTDGIDVIGSTDLLILDSIIETGDDCIAINGGTSRVNITRIACGPGHGISIGSLGKDGRYDQVEAISVSNCSFRGTKNGVRIKTWQGGSGFARRINFSDINFDAAYNPVIIDQYYCPHETCNIQKSAVKVSDVKYVRLSGTSMSKGATINFSCSQTVPCTDILIEDVHIVPIDQEPPSVQCINAQISLPVVQGTRLPITSNDAATTAAAMNLQHNLAKIQADAMPGHYEAELDLEINDFPQNAR